MGVGIGEGEEGGKIYIFGFLVGLREGLEGEAICLLCRLFVYDFYSSSARRREQWRMWYLRRVMGLRCKSLDCEDVAY